MTISEAIRILDPDTTLAALAEIEYYAGFGGRKAKVAACDEACRIACDALRTHTKQLNAAKKAIKLAASGHCCSICGRDCIGGGVTACSAFAWDGTCGGDG